MARKDMRRRVGIIGSSKYENRRKIKELIFKMKNSLDGGFIIVSGGRHAGADTYVKKYSLEMKIEYKEFNPAHTAPTLYSALRENYYGKPYSPRHYFHRNSLMLKYVDDLIIFQGEFDKDNQDIDAVIKEALKLNINFILIS